MTPRNATLLGRKIAQYMQLPRMHSEFDQGSRLFPRPPLLVTGDIDGMPLEAMIGLRPHRDISGEELREVFNEFVDGYLVSKEYRNDPSTKDPIKFMQRTLRIHPNELVYVSPTLNKAALARDETYVDCLGYLLWLISRAGYPLIVTPTDMRVWVDGVEIGVQEGVILSEYEVNRIGLPARDWHLFCTRERPAGRKHFSIMYWVLRQLDNGMADVPPKLVPLIRNIALCLVWGDRHDHARAGLYEEATPGALRKALRRAVLTETDPVAASKKLLVPNVLTAGEYRRTIKGVDAVGCVLWSEDERETYLRFILKALSL